MTVKFSGHITAAIITMSNTTEITGLGFSRNCLCNPAFEKAVVW